MPRSARCRRRAPCLPSLRGIEELTQVREPGEHSTLDSAQRLAEPLGQFRLREAAVVGELERLALDVGQLAKRLLDALALEPKPRVVGGRRPGARVVGLGELLGAPALLPPDEIDG